MDINIRTPAPEKLELAFKLVAYSSLKENGLPLNDDTISTEAARIERCVEHHYKRDPSGKNEELDFSPFASWFLQTNFNELVFGDTYKGLYLDDVPDVEYTEEVYDFDDD